MAATNESIKTLKNPVKGKEAKVPKVKPVKPLKLIEKKKWGNLTPAACLKSIKTASHLSSKSVNSNASAVGVRLDPADRLSLHFVAVDALSKCMRYPCAMQKALWSQCCASHATRPRGK